MKRLWITLAVVALAAIAALPAAAGAPDFCDSDSPKYDSDHPTCTTTTTPDTSTTTSTTIPGHAECIFDAETGVLASWHGHEGEERTCIWNVDNPDNTFEFQIKSPDESVTKVKLPHLIVNADIVFPTPKCFEASGRGLSGPVLPRRLLDVLARLRRMR